LHTTLNVMNNTIPVTAQLVEQRLEHRVTDAAAVASRQSDRYQALCGQRFIAAALAAPPGRPCPDCAAVLASDSEAVAAPGHQPRHRRHGLLRRLLPTVLGQRGTDR
jgi:hypothetical protein